VHTAHTQGLEFGAHRRDWFQAIDFVRCETAVAGTSTLFSELNRQVPILVLKKLYFPEGNSVYPFYALHGGDSRGSFMHFSLTF
jgi:hypothetical protein